MADQWMHLTHDEVVMGFVASCVEDAAARAGVDYLEMFERMERVALIDEYIYPCYDALHTEGRAALTTNILATLEAWEKRKAQ